MISSGAGSIERLQQTSLKRKSHHVHRGQPGLKKTPAPGGGDGTPTVRPRFSVLSVLLSQGENDTQGFLPGNRGQGGRRDKASLRVGKLRRRDKAIQGKGKTRNAFKAKRQDKESFLPSFLPSREKNKKRPTLFIFMPTVVSTPRENAGHRQEPAGTDRARSEEHNKTHHIASHQK